MVVMVCGRYIVVQPPFNLINLKKKTKEKVTVNQNFIDFLMAYYSKFLKAQGFSGPKMNVMSTPQHYHTCTYMYRAMLGIHPSASHKEACWIHPD